MIITLWNRWFNLFSFLILFLCLSSKPATASTQETTTAPYNFEGYVGLGFPSFTSYGVSYYHGPQRDVGIRFQTGSGTMSGAVGFDDHYEEILFFANRSKASETFERFVGLGIGRQELKVQTNFRDRDDNLFMETETFEKTYVKLNFSVAVVLPNGFSYGSDFGITYPIGSSSTYTANENARGDNLSTYISTRRNFDLFKTLFGSGASLQINLFRFGWCF